MVRKTFSPSYKWDNYDFNLPTVLYNANYHLKRAWGGYQLVDSKGNIVKEWYFMPSLTDLFDLAKDLQIM